MTPSLIQGTPVSSPKAAEWLKNVLVKGSTENGDKSMLLISVNNKSYSLMAGEPVLVRMETLRRAALYSTESPAEGYELLARLLARSRAGDKLSLFDAGYLVETFKQAHLANKPLLAAGIDGRVWVSEAIRSGAGDTASMEFAASLMESGTQPGRWPNDHSRRAQSGAAGNPLLARNLKNFGL